MKDLIIFLLGVLTCFLTLTTVVGISYSSAVILGRGLGMCSGVLLAAKIFIKNRASEENNKSAVALLREMMETAYGKKPLYLWVRDHKERLDAVIAQSLPQALTTGSTSTVRVCEHEFVNHIMPGRPQICKKCGLGMQS